MLTEHIPLPDPARGKVYARMHLDRCTHELFQSGFSNIVVLGEVHDSVAAKATEELNTRMAVAKTLGA